MAVDSRGYVTGVWSLVVWLWTSLVALWIRFTVGARYSPRVFLCAEATYLSCLFSAWLAQRTTPRQYFVFKATPRTTPAHPEGLQNAEAADPILADDATRGFIAHVIRSKLHRADPTTFIPRLLRVEVGRRLRGGFIADILQLHLHWNTNTADVPTESPLTRKVATLPSSLVVKMNPTGFRSRLSCIMLGTAREAGFYNFFAPDAPTTTNTNRNAHALTKPPLALPNVYYASNSSWTGEYLVLMEDLSAFTTSACPLLGNQCWGPVSISPPITTPPSALTVLHNCFMRMADGHAYYWRDPQLLKQSWLKNVLWRKGADRGRWELAFQRLRVNWGKVQAAAYQQREGDDKLTAKELEEVKKNRFMISIPFRDTMAAHIKATNWQTYQTNFNLADPKTPWTLCHGDFHAANMLYRLCPTPASAYVGGSRAEKGGEEDVYMVDWSEVGVGCPATEIAQFMISNATIELRRAHERDLVAAYHARLVEGGVSATEFPLEECWARYQAGGIDRWIQMFNLMGGWGLLPVPAADWFEQQVSAFIVDHRSTCPKPPIFQSVYCAQ
eukprot:TRINITY_DN507_c0_g1_i1.p1 TRINITY_DN507_c0_g1~~TRINITY_DN507_c0_g1_i1.p1  ORF type:complete len:557 (-),score=69.93 TRINITY_DN507_c0_g1_i1:22-1692(-)